MAFDADTLYYSNNSPGHPGPFTPRQLSSIPSRKISVLYRDADGISTGELNVRIVWVDDVALYLERSTADDFMVPWSDILWIEPEQ